MKFGTRIVHPPLINFGCGPKSAATPGGRGGHFSKWPPVWMLSSYKAVFLVIKDSKIIILVLELMV